LKDRFWTKPAFSGRNGLRNPGARVGNSLKNKKVSAKRLAEKKKKKKHWANVWWDQPKKKINIGEEDKKKLHIMTRRNIVVEDNNVWPVPEILLFTSFHSEYFQQNARRGTAKKDKA